MVTFFEITFDQPAGSMGLHLLARIDQGLVQLQGQACGRGQRAIGDACDAIKDQPFELASVGMQNPVEEVGIGDDLA